MKSNQASLQLPVRRAKNMKLKIFFGALQQKRFLICVQDEGGRKQPIIKIYGGIKNEHEHYHGAVITEWNDKSSVSLGMLVFVTKEPYFYDKLKDKKISYFSFFTET